MSEVKKSGLDLLREPFPPNLISKLPKPTKAQAEAIKADFKKGIRCQLCGTWHHPDVAHLDYVGHAALTHRLLEVDPNWTWEPMSFDELGLPRFDKNGGLWIKLTVCGVTRYGYGNAETSQYKDIGAREKEVIGDALRNAGMRFGAALDLWHKGDLHADDDVASDPQTAKSISKAECGPVKSVENYIKGDSSPSNPGNYIVQCGLQYKGESLDKMGIDKVISYRKWLEDQSKKRNQPIEGKFSEFMEMSQTYLTMKKLKGELSEPPVQNQDDEIPF